ncbi:MAG: cytidine deaminase [Flavobacteriales bacterium]|nr:cytidine deaminase [Flavobacteriales bacterium]MCB0811207.1 cytidine deaminase [Flavobacteriales bacterium]
MGIPHSVPLDLVIHASAAGLSEADQTLLNAAHEAALRAYAPYSNFQVGAALRMRDGRVVTGSNQENASFPAGTCAERTALHAAMAFDPNGVVETMAIVVPSVTGERPVTPCGICRQALLEQEMRQKRAPLRLLMAVPNGPVYEVSSAGQLLPLSFDASFLNG